MNLIVGIVIIIHGFFAGTELSTPDMSAVIAEVESMGYVVYYPEVSNDPLVAAYQIRDTVTLSYQEHPSIKPHLFGVSLGGTSSLYYTKVLGGYPYIRSLTMIDSPLYGQLLPGCPWFNYCSNSLFMYYLHLGSDTPRFFGQPLYKQIIASNGSFTKPLDGTPCIVSFPGKHLDIASNSGFRDEIIQSLNGVC